MRAECTDRTYSQYYIHTRGNHWFFFSSFRIYFSHRFLYFPTIVNGFLFSSSVLFGPFIFAAIHEKPVCISHKVLLFFYICVQFSLSLWFISKSISWRHKQLQHLFNANNYYAYRLRFYAIQWRATFSRDWEKIKKIRYLSFLFIIFDVEVV